MTSRTALAACMMLACAALYGADTKNVDRTLPLKADGLVTIESHNGSIHLQTWDRPQIEIHARIESAGSSAEDRRRFDQTEVEIDSSPDSVRIKTKHPDFCCSFTGSNPEVHYTIQAPRTARLRIRDHNSRTEIRDLSAALDIEAHNGSVHVQGLNGPLNMGLHNGKATVDFASFTGSSSVETHNGSVELVMPAASRFDLRSESHNGGVDSDFPVAARMAGRRGQNLYGTVNGGGPALRLNSHNGHFRLRAK